MATRRIVDDPDFGRIIIGSNRRAHNITMRTRPDGLHVTVPPFTRLSDALRVVNDYRPQLIANFEAQRPKRLDTDYQIDAPCFRLNITLGNVRRFSVRFNDELATILCPECTDFNSPSVQKLLRAAIVRALKRQASLLLPPLLAEWSRRTDLKYRKVRITGAKSRWGSCSSAGTISLSCYLLLLPPHLMDFVILHELCHTREMNHGERFHALLNSLTDNLEPQLNSELRKARIAPKYNL